VPLADVARRHEAPRGRGRPYALVRFQGAPLPSLFELLEGEGVAYATSFSKTIAPGLRTGYVLLPPRLTAPLADLAASSYVAPLVLTQAIVAEFLARGHLDAALRSSRERLRERRDAMLAALGEHLPDADWSRPEGGYFVWLELPGVDAGHLLDAAAARGVAFVPGPDFGGAPNTARLAFSSAGSAQIHAGVTRLAAVVRSLRRGRLWKAA
jgi:2-aminoadipate transaminase